MKSKKLILIASPPACGKTTLAKKLAVALENVVYIDKDALNPFGKQICRIGGQDYNPDSPFFVKEVREIEYEVTVGMGLEALEFANTVLINAPFGKELWDADYMRDLKVKASDLGAELYVVFIEATPELCKARIIDRNNIRDKFKIENWEAYISKVNFKTPSHLSDILKLYLYHNETDEIAAKSFASLLEFLKRS